MMRVAVVDYGSGNLASASRALAVAAERAGLDATRCDEGVDLVALQADGAAELVGRQLSAVDQAVQGPVT